MSEKLNLKELSTLLSQRSNLSQEEAEVFLQELFDVISGSLSDNEQVSIKDFGTFKLSFEHSEGVDRDTSLHKEISFSPDKELEELVNKPFSHFEPTLINEDAELSSIDLPDESNTVDKIDVDEEEILEPSTEETSDSAEILRSEIEEPPILEKQDEIVSEEESEVEDKESETLEHVPIFTEEESLSETVSDVAGENAIDGCVDESDDAFPDDVEPLHFPEKKEEPVIEKLVEGAPEERKHLYEPVKPMTYTHYRKDSAKNRDKKSKKRSIIIGASLIGVVILGITFFLLIKLFSFNPEKKVEYIELSPIDSMYNQDVTPDSATYPAGVINADSTVSAPVALSENSVDELAAQQPADEKTEAVKTDALQPAARSSVTQRPKVVTLKAGEGLRDVAYRSLGHREFWVYIYLKNQTKIKDPNVVPVGSELVLPHDSEFNLNSKDPYAIANARDLGYEVLRKLQ